MRNPGYWGAVLALAMVMAAGCGTMGGGNQFQNTVYDTHRRVANIEKTVQGSLGKLNETTAELSARLDSNEQMAKTLQTTVEENSARLKSLEDKLDQMRATMYRMDNRSGGTRVGVPSEVMPGDDVRVGPPTGQTPEPGALSSLSPGTTPAPTGTPVAAAPPTAPAPTPATTPAVASVNATEDYQQAQRTYAKQDYAAALEQFSAYLQRYPNSENAANAQFWKAKSLQMMEQYEQAIAEFEKVRRNYPSSGKVAYAMQNQAVCHGRLGQTERAIELYQQVIKEFPMTPAADQAKTDLKKLQGKQ